MSASSKEPIGKETLWQIEPEDPTKPSAVEGTLTEVGASRSVAPRSANASDGGKADMDRVASVLVGIAMRLLARRIDETGGDRC
jgi:hypothetical protein